MENYGQIKVTDLHGAPLSKVNIQLIWIIYLFSNLFFLGLIQIYVKAFQKEKSGTVSFFKDGYTNLTGRFDYASASGANITSVDKFAIFM